MKSNRIKPIDRICIYFFYDKDGIVDEYVLFCLEKMSSFADNILFVSNSKLTKKSIEKLKRNKSVVIKERNNIGFDVWAYKDGIEAIGWDNIIQYREVIFMNFTIVGPVYPLEEMFRKMDSLEVDFWGINVHSGEKFDPWGIMSDNTIPKHLQSHFIAVRSNMLKSVYFKEYWDNMRPIESYQQAIGYHEAIFTKKFADMGFKWSSYVDTDYLDEIVSYPLMFTPKEVIGKQRAPFFKRKALFLPLSDQLGSITGMAAAETIDIVMGLGYDLSMVMPNITRTSNQYDIRQSINAVKIIDNNYTVGKYLAKSAIIIYVDNKIHIESVRRYIDQFTELGFSVNIICGDDSKKYIDQEIGSYKNTHYTAGSYIDFMKQIKDKSKIVSTIGILSLGRNKDRETGACNIKEFESVRYGLESLFCNRSVIEQFTSNLITSPIYGGFASAPAEYDMPLDRRNLWGDNYTKVKEFLNSINIDVDIDRGKLPLESTDGIYWIRADVFANLKWSEIITEMNRNSPERQKLLFNLSIPYIIQSSGRILGYGMTSQVAQNKIIITEHKRLNYVPTVRDALRNRPSEAGTFYYMSGGIYAEKNSVKIMPEANSNNNRCNFISHAILDCAEIRFDPFEGGVVCENPKAFINGIPVDIVPKNATISYVGGDLFISDDPQYIIREEVHIGDLIEISFDHIERFIYADFMPGIEDETGMGFGQVICHYIDRYNLYNANRGYYKYINRFLSKLNHRKRI